MSKPPFDQEQEKKAESSRINDFACEKKPVFHPFIVSPLTWMRRPPSFDANFYITACYDIGYSMCILAPLLIFFLYAVKFTTPLRISKDIAAHIDPLVSILCCWAFMGLHFLALKQYLFFKKINKFFALLLTKIFPLLSIFSVTFWILADK